MCTMWSHTSFSRSRSWLTISSVLRKRLRCSVSQSMASRSRWFDGSSRISRSGLLNSVPASATRMRQPPENSPQGRAWASLSKPRPCRIEAARAGAEAAPISSSRAWISASRRPSWQVSASASRALRSTSAASTASSTRDVAAGRVLRHRADAGAAHQVDARRRRPRSGPGSGAAGSICRRRCGRPGRPSSRRKRPPRRGRTGRARRGERKGR